MNELTDAEISRRLALAIGWKAEQIVEYPGQDYIGLPVWIFGDRIKLFSYRWPSIIWPIAEHFDCFPAKTPWSGTEHSWSAFFDDSWDSGVTEYVETDTAAKAVALAVIKAKEKQDTMIPLKTIKTSLQGVF